MRKIVMILLAVIPLTGYSQDIITLRNGKQINCEITRVDSSVIYYNFQKDERKISSFIELSDIRSYQINEPDSLQNKSIDDLIFFQENTVIIDTTQYVKETSRWINMVTFSMNYGLHAYGWLLQYYGYNLKNTSKWIIPVIFGFEIFELYEDYFSLSDYSMANIGYCTGGISPFCKLNDYLFLKLGINFIFGSELLKDYYGHESSNTFFGASSSQGIYFISKSKVGVTVGISLCEMLQGSKVYEDDIGLKLEAGIKF